jgi:poly(3-hydroxybutyrate) depolymerase
MTIDANQFLGRKLNRLMQLSLRHFIALFAPLLSVAIYAPTAQADPVTGSADERGKIVARSVEHGEYMLYTPTREPRGILAVVHGSLAEDGSAMEAANVFIRRWVDEAEKRQLVLIAPAFDQENYGGHAGPGGGYRGLFGRHVGADDFLNAIVDAVAEAHPPLKAKFYLYGHSAGGQFVSRYIVKHPHRVFGAVISAAARFAFPDPKVPWTNGMARLQRRIRWSDDAPWEQFDYQPDPNGWLEAATLPVTVVVGAKDTEKVKAGAGQRGETHVERGREWAKSMNAYAREHGKRGRVGFVAVPGIGHNSKKLTPSAIKAMWRE